MKINKLASFSTLSSNSGLNQRLSSTVIFLPLKIAKSQLPLILPSGSGKKRKYPEIERAHGQAKAVRPSDIYCLGKSKIKQHKIALYSKLSSSYTAAVLRAAVR